MINKKLEEYGGKLCLTCRYCNVMTGQCQKTGHYNHINDNYCKRWKIAKDLIQHRPKKEKKVEQLKLWK